MVPIISRKLPAGNSLNRGSVFPVIFYGWRCPDPKQAFPWNSKISTVAGWLQTTAMSFLLIFGGLRYSFPKHEFQTGFNWSIRDPGIELGWGRQGRRNPPPIRASQLKKVKDLIVYKDDQFYSTFPSIVKRPNGELLVAFRRAPDRRRLGETAIHAHRSQQLSGFGPVQGRRRDVEPDAGVDLCPSVWRLAGSVHGAIDGPFDSLHQLWLGVCPA